MNLHDYAFLLPSLSLRKYPENSAAPIGTEKMPITESVAHKDVPLEDISGTSAKGSNLTLAAYKVHSFPTTF